MQRERAPAPALCRYLNSTRFPEDISSWLNWKGLAKTREISSNMHSADQSDWNTIFPSSPPSVYSLLLEPRGMMTMPFGPFREGGRQKISLEYVTTFWARSGRERFEENNVGNEHLLLTPLALGLPAKLRAAESAVEAPRLEDEDEWENRWPKDATR